MEKFYANIPNLESLRCLRDLDEFERVIFYSDPITQEQHPQEYGRIKFKGFFLHILAGKIEFDNCRFCNHPLEVVFDKVFPRSDDPLNIFDFYDIYAKCDGCGSRGPTKRMRIPDKEAADDESKEWIKSFVLDNYKQMNPHKWG